MKRIIYLSWPAQEITGGIKMAFRHAEALRESGFEALIATQDSRPPGWFETTVPVVGLAAVERQRDVLAFPENNHELLTQFASWPNRKVVFCQNQILVCLGLGGQQDYAEFGVSDIICCSEMAAYFCRRRFPKLAVHVVPNYVDPGRFQCPNRKKLRIAFMPRKRPLELACIHDLFRSDNPQFRGVPWHRIEGLPESEVAAVLRESAVFLSLCRFEACALSLLEAMASGCVVAGFTGIGSREYTTEKNGFWAAEDDCIECVDQLKRAVELVSAGGSAYREMCEAAVLTARQYSRQRFVQRLVEVWKILAV